MKYFESFLSSLDSDESKIIQEMIDAIKKLEPEAHEGISYGMPAFKLNDRPLIGFGKHSHGLSIYPFDPRVITAASEELKDFECGKGVIRFTPDRPLPLSTIELLVSLRKQNLSA